MGSPRIGGTRYPRFFIDLANAKAEEAEADTI